MNVVFFLWGDFLASKFYVSTFRNTVGSIFIGRVQGRGTTQKKEYNNFQIVKLTEESLVMSLL
jgi:hypothetical protein